MNQNIAQLIENAEEECLKHTRKKFRGIAENVDLQSIKTSVELFGNLLDALNEELKNGDKNSKLTNAMKFCLRQMIYSEFKDVLEKIEDGEVEKIKTY